MTFVELLERYRIECGVSGSPITDVATVKGEHLRLKTWLQQANVDIQTEHGGLWEFLRAEGATTIPASASLLSIPEWAAGGVRAWKIDEFRIAGNGEPRARSVPLEFVPYDQFRNGVGLSVTPAGKPLYFTVRRGDKAIMVAPQADQAYTLYFDYWRNPVVIDDNGDEPVWPQQYHMLAVYRAMIDYGYFEAAPEALARARERHDEMMFKLKLEQLPGPTWGGPLA